MEHEDDCFNIEQKRIIIKYIEGHGAFHRGQLSEYLKIWKLLFNELKASDFDCLTVDECEYLVQSWIKDTEDFQSSNPNATISEMDKVLLMALDVHKVPLTNKALNCILDHIEGDGNLAKLWNTIALEMESVILLNRSPAFWNKAFDGWSNHVLSRQKLFSQWIDAYGDGEGNSFKLSDGQIRLSEYLKKNEVVESIQHVCRVCLQIHDPINTTPITVYLQSFALSIIEMMDLCSKIKIIEDDTLPQHICNGCFILLKDAYKFKTLYERSNLQLMADANKSENSVPAKYEMFAKNVASNNNNFHDSVIEGDWNEIVDENEDDQFSEVLSAKDVNIDEDISLNSVDNATGGSIEKTPEQVKPPLQCETCGITVPNLRKLGSHRRTHDKRSQTCPFCGKVFKTLLTLNVHLRTHTGERPYICEICGKAFKTVGSSMNHRVTHSTAKNFKCDQCQFKTSTQSNLRIHFRTHSGDRPYVCNHCSMSFTTASNKLKHTRNIHEKVKNHKCKDCNRSFFSRESARKHEITHTGEKPYICTCGSRYGWYNGLKKHMTSHHPGLHIPSEKSFVLKIIQSGRTGI